MLQSYNLKILLISFATFIIGTLNAQNPNWQPPISGNFAYTANVIATIKVDAVSSNNVDDSVCFFVGNQIRGLSNSINIGNGNIIHFITLYSNISDENMDIKIYHKNSNHVYNLVAPLKFKTQSIFGNINNPMVLNAYADNNSPISISNVPAQQTIEGLAFKTIDMHDYLIQPDPFDVEWSYVPNPNLNVYFIGSVLHVDGAIGFTGQTQLIVKASELTTAALGITDIEHPSSSRNTPSQQIAQTTITYNVSSLYSPPAWHPIPSQGIVTGAQFTPVNLHDYEYQYGGAAIQYDYLPIIEINNPAVTKPVWNVPNVYPNSMTVVARLDYTPKYHFHHKDDVLVAYINNEIHGLAVKDSSTGLFFLSIGGSLSGEPITLKLYSGAIKKIFTLQNIFNYVAHNIIGNPDEPFKIEFAPLVPIVPSSPLVGGYAVMPILIKDAAYLGTMKFKFYAFDPLYPLYLRAETETSFCVVANASELVTMYQDADNDGLGNPNVTIQACVVTSGYVTNDDDCDDTNAVDPLITMTVTENSGSMPNDGNICSGATVLLIAAGGTSYEWSNGGTSSNNAVSPIETTNYTVTVTHSSGCKGSKTTSIDVEGTIVKTESNDGNGSLRNVLECIVDGGVITYNQPFQTSTILTAPLIINKNVSIIGLSIFHPEVSIDFNTAVFGIQLNSNKTLTLTNVDLKLINEGVKKTFVGPGMLVINAFSKIK